MNYREMLNKVTEIANEVDLYKLEIEYYEADESGCEYQTTIKIDRQII